MGAGGSIHPGTKPPAPASKVAGQNSAGKRRDTMKNAYKVALHRLGANEVENDKYRVQSITGPGPDITVRGMVVAAGDRIDRTTAIALGSVADITTTPAFASAR
jgi:hypothetical protein